MEEGLLVQLEAGYESNHNIIFLGQIRQITCGKENNGVDSFVDIAAVDGDQLYANGFVSLTIAAGSNDTQRLNSIVQANDTTVKIDDNVTNDTKLPRARVYHGPLRYYLNGATAQIGAHWYVDNGQVGVLQKDVYSTQEVTQINRSTGMIGLPTTTLQGVHVRCQLNPNLKAGCPIKLENDTIQQMQIGLSITETSQLDQSAIKLSPNGIYKVLAVDHFGVMRGSGDDWYTHLICYSTVPALASTKFWVKQ